MIDCLHPLWSLDRGHQFQIFPVEIYLLLQTSKVRIMSYFYLITKKLRKKNLMILFILSIIKNLSKFNLFGISQVVETRTFILDLRAKIRIWLVVVGLTTMVKMKLMLNYCRTLLELKYLNKPKEFLTPILNISKN